MHSHGYIQPQSYFHILAITVNRLQVNLHLFIFNSFFFFYFSFCSLFWGNGFSCYWTKFIIALEKIEWQEKYTCLCYAHTIWKNEIMRDDKARRFSTQWSMCQKRNKWYYVKEKGMKLLSHNTWLLKHFQWNSFCYLHF